MCGSRKNGRRWIGCDLSRFAIHVTRKRLLDIEGCRSFEILNLGKYERQYWQGVTFGEKANPLLSRHSMNTWPLSSSFMAHSRWWG